MENPSAFNPQEISQKEVVEPKDPQQPHTTKWENDSCILLSNSGIVLPIDHCKHNPSYVSLHGSIIIHKCIPLWAHMTVHVLGAWEGRSESMYCSLSHTWVWRITTDQTCHIYTHVLYKPYYSSDIHKHIIIYLYTYIQVQTYWASQLASWLTCSKDTAVSTVIRVLTVSTKYMLKKQ